jgi:RNA polymerase sigma-70 factor (ECF subfamily)
MSQDRYLLRRLEEGDADALRQIYEKYVDDLVVVAASLLGDVHEAEDCLQAVLTRFAEAAGHIRIRRNLKGYLVSSVANRARDHLRKRKRQPSSLIEELDCRTTPENPVSQLIEAEESARLVEAISELPYEQREVFVLHVQGEMSFRQIAGLVGVSVNTAKSRYRYAIEKIRALLHKETEHE